MFNPGNLQNWPTLQQFVGNLNAVIAAYGVQAITSTTSKTVPINFGLTLPAPPSTVIVWVIKPPAGTSTVLGCDLNDGSQSDTGCSVDLTGFPTLNHKIGWVALT